MRAIVTGATKGIGREMAILLVKKGFDVAVCARTAEDVAEFKTELEGLREGVEVIAEAVDMSKKEAVKAFAKKICTAWDTLDILVNNAGVFIPCSLSDPTNEASFELMMDTNLYSAYYMTQGVLSLLEKQKGSYIFNMCSIASFKSYSAYAVSKHAMLGYSRVLRDELKEKGVRVSAVMPGATLTASWDGVDLPQERFMKATDIAESVWSIYALSDRTVVEEIILRPQLGDI